MNRKSWVETLGLALALTTLTGAIYAQQFKLESGGAISQTNPAAVIRVTAVDKPDVYDTIEPEDKNGNLSFHIKVRGRCQEGRQIEAASMTVGNGTDKKPSFVPFNSTLSYIGADLGAKWSFLGVTVPFLLPEAPSSPVAACNAEVARRVANGESRTSLLRNGFEVQSPTAYSAALYIDCKGWFEDGPADTTRLPLTIHCMPTGYTPPRTPSPPQRTPAPAPTPPQRMPTPPPPLTSVAVAAIPAETTGRACPLYVNFKGKIQPNPDSKYTTLNTKYRFVGDHGYQTPWTFVAVSRSEPRIVNGRRFIQAPPNNPGGTILAPGEKPKIPLYLGWMELEVQLPNGSKRSERATFSVDCNVAPPRPRIKASNE